MNNVISSAARSALTIEVGSLQYAIESQSLQLYSPICMYALPQHSPTLVPPNKVCEQQHAQINNAGIFRAL